MTQAPKKTIATQPFQKPTHPTQIPHSPHEMQPLSIQPSMSQPPNQNRHSCISLSRKIPPTPIYFPDKNRTSYASFQSRPRSAGPSRVHLSKKRYRAFFVEPALTVWLLANENPSIPTSKPSLLVTYAMPKYQRKAQIAVVTAELQLRGEEIELHD